MIENCLAVGWLTHDTKEERLDTFFLFDKAIRTRLSDFANAAFKNTNITADIVIEDVDREIASELFADFVESSDVEALTRLSMPPPLQMLEEMRDVGQIDVRGYATNVLSIFQTALFRHPTLAGLRFVLDGVEREAHLKVRTSSRLELRRMSLIVSSSWTLYMLGALNDYFGAAIDPELERVKGMLGAYAGHHVGLRRLIRHVVADGPTDNEEATTRSSYVPLKLAANCSDVVREFIRNPGEWTLQDVDTMLRMPLPHLGLVAGCNFAIVHTLLNYLAGLATVFYDSKGELRDRFLGLLRAYYPWHLELFREDMIDKDAGPPILYDVVRNPFAHSLGLDTRIIGGDRGTKRVVRSSRGPDWRVGVTRIIRSEGGAGLDDTMLRESKFRARMRCLRRCTD